MVIRFTLCVALFLMFASSTFADDKKACDGGCCAAPATENEENSAEKQTPAVLAFTMQSIDGEDVDLARYQGKVVMFVNVASKCGNTPQYKLLQQLHEKYHEQGLAILGFPANDFGKQEPGSNEQIAEFCEKNYGVTFDMFAKITVTGEEKHPLYQYLTDSQTNPDSPGEVSWNFEKFLLGRDGKIIARFKPGTKPDAPEVISAIEEALAANQQADAS